MTGPTFLPWWQASALLLDPVEVQAATAGEAEDVARAEWRDEGERPEVVETRQIEHPSTTSPSVDAS